MDTGYDPIKVDAYGVTRALWQLTKLAPRKKPAPRPERPVCYHIRQARIRASAPKVK